MQVCEKCGGQKILQNDIPVCIFCFGKQQVVPKKPPVMIEDPGEKAMDQILGQVNVGTNKSTTKIDATKRSVANASTIQDALLVMEQLPMPKDVKEFRKIQKIIKLMKEVTGEQ